MKQEIRDIFYLLQHNDRIDTTDKRKLRRYVEDLETKVEKITEYVDNMANSDFVYIDIAIKELKDILRGDDDDRKSVVK